MNILNKAKKIIKRSGMIYNLFIYNLWKDKLIRNISSKEEINIIFFVLYEGMWKNDYLVKLLFKDKRFNPYIVSCPYPNHPYDFSRSNQEQIERSFREKGLPFVKGYDFDNKKWFDIKSLHPDIVFYQQPYGAEYKGFRIKSLWKSCLFCYIPYCYDLEEGDTFLNHFLQNIAWKFFLPSEFEKSRAQKSQVNGGENVSVVGHPLADYLIWPKQPLNNSVWKIQDDSVKRVIWAPHHSILKDDALDYSNFLLIAEDMLKLAKEYSDRIQFAFKPHPVLKRKLYILKDWGKDKTDIYYNQWAEMQNSVLADGNYTDLFLTSTAMIHDCGTFTIEYLYLKKPVMFIGTQEHKKRLTQFGKMCFDQHYVGNSIYEIKKFLDCVVLGGEDPKKESRELFFNNYLLPPNNQSVAENIYEVLTNLSSK